MGSSVKVLLACRDSRFSKELVVFLRRRGYQVERASSLTKVSDKLAKLEYHVLVADLDNCGSRVQDLIRDLCQRDQELVVVVMGGQDSAETAVTTLQSGATDYLCKPLTPERVWQAIENALAGKGISTRPAGQLMRNIGQRLRARRQQLSLTLRQVARRSGLSVSLISQVERAESAVSIASLQRLASALNLSLSSLFEGY